MPRGGARPGAGRPKGTGGKPKPPEPGTVPDGPPTKVEKQLSPEMLVRQEIQRQVDEVGRVGLTEAVIKQAALESFACLRVAAARGNIKAAKWLLDLLLTQPDKPFAEQARTYSADQVESELRGVLEKLELPEAVTELVIARYRTATPALAAHTEDGEDLDVELLPPYREGEDA